jgi:crotonobetainyl-CoA:carnitine CoA-transferase CaiB-like acyl-CoA transferase
MAVFPLNGIRVLDLSRVLAGPMCTMTLADLGADVLKVERPGEGDDTRGWGPPFADDGQSAYFRSVNRNKLSIALDLGLPAHLAHLLELVRAADVVVENYLPGALARKGIDAGQLLRECPQLVWCTISGFGADSERPGYDFVVQAEAGWMAITGPADGEPSKVGVALADVLAGRDAAIAILAALVGRERQTPAQRQLHISLYHSAVAGLVNVAQNALVTGQPSVRWGNAHPNLVPYELFAAADRSFVLAVGNDAQWLAAAAALGFGHPDVADGWRTNAGRVADRARLVPALAAHLRQRDAAIWMEALRAAGVPCGLVRSVPEAIADVAADPRTGVSSAVGGQLRFPPPALDAHGPLVRAHGWGAFGVTPAMPSSAPAVTR